MSEHLAFPTVLLKVSGEGLGGSDGFGIGKTRLDSLVGEIALVVATGARVGLVLGGGNFVRGASLAACGIDRAVCDSVGMLATVMNGAVLTEVLEAAGVPARHLCAAGVVAGLPRAGAGTGHAALAEGRVAVFSGGTGNPFFTTDTAGALRAREIGADLLVKATKVDGVYDSDPITNPGAQRLVNLSYDEILTRGLGVMDQAAIALCREAAIPILVCDLFVPGNLLRVVTGEAVGTRIG